MREMDGIPGLAPCHALFICKATEALKMASWLGICLQVTCWPTATLRRKVEPFGGLKLAKVPSGNLVRAVFCSLIFTRTIAYCSYIRVGKQLRAWAWNVLTLNLQLGYSISLDVYYYVLRSLFRKSRSRRTQLPSITVAACEQWNCFYWNSASDIWPI